jgi:16S rRNA (uracil1498-N3)-methyltransferase
VASIQPLHTAHSVLRLTGERATKKQAHWQSVAVAACEQCGRNRVPTVHPVRELAAWLKALTSEDSTGKEMRCVLSLAEGAIGLPALPSGGPPAQPMLFLSGPEGGLSPAEDALARGTGFAPMMLGPRILRAETASLMALVLALDRE